MQKLDAFVFRKGLLIVLFSFFIKQANGAVSQILNDSFFQNPAELKVVNNAQAVVGNVFINPNIQFNGRSYGVSGNENSNVTDYLPNHKI